MKGKTDSNNPEEPIMARVTYTRPASTVVRAGDLFEGLAEIAERRNAKRAAKKAAYQRELQAYERELAQWKARVAPIAAFANAAGPAPAAAFDNVAPQTVAAAPQQSAARPARIDAKDAGRYRLAEIKAGNLVIVAATWMERVAADTYIRKTHGRKALAAARKAARAAR